MRRLAPLFALSALIGLFFWKLAFTNLILARGDTFLYFYPYWDYRGQVLRTGHLPLWNPYLFMGVPFLANSQAGVLYPLNWPLAFLSAPTAVKVAVLIHLWIAAAGAYLFARRVMGQTASGAFLAATLFSLGGYLSAQVEHVNQLQGLAWFPWLLWIVDRLVQSVRLKWGLVGTAGTIVALQFLAGHTQSAFICLFGAGLYAVVMGRGRFAQTNTDSVFDPRAKASAREAIRVPSKKWQALLRRYLSAGRRLARLVPAVLLGLLLAAPQLLPTLELSRLSPRGGGLPFREALSFSLHPLLFGRALLPTYSRALASEFVAHLGVLGLLLVALGVMNRPRDSRRWAVIGLALGGLFLALGGFNPVYQLLALAPPFRLFRAPARWLFLFAFGASMLAGLGLDSLREPWGRRTRAFLIGLPLVLMAWSLAPAGLTPPGETGPLGFPSRLEWIGWGLSAVAGWLILSRTARLSRTRFARPMLLSLVLLELFAASRPLAYNHPTFPEAYSSLRPAMTQLLVAREGELPPGRFLSMSALRFDPGDLAELHSAWDGQLPAEAVYDAVVATKAKEVLSPNLPLAWRVPGVDGFDGGILPLSNYVRFEALFLPGERISPDGRLRENLTRLPDERVLQLANVRFLITDKVDDAWVDGVYYDLQFTLTVTPDNPAVVDRVPEFQATALGLYLEAAQGLPGERLGQVRFWLDSGDEVTVELLPPAGLPGVAIVRLPQPSKLARIQIDSEVGELEVRGAALVDERTGDFASLTLGPYRIVHSGDVKIYEYLNRLPRAYLVGNAVVVPDDEAALKALGAADFDPGRMVVLSSGNAQAQSNSTGSARVLRYEAEDVLVQTESESPATLVLSDAFYPGWKATIDGSPAPIERANLLFRAVAVPSGRHAVHFTYRPRTLQMGWVLLGIGGLLMAGAGVAHLTTKDKSRMIVPPSSFVLNRARRSS